MITRSADHLYPMNFENDNGLWTGVGSNARQCLVGQWGCDLMGFFFDAQGTLLRNELRVLDRFDLDGGHWRDELGARPGLIQVKRFVWTPVPSSTSRSWTDDGVGIEDHSEYFDNAANDPTVSDEEKAEVRASLHRWYEAGQFVLWWGNDFWVDGSGEIVAS